MKIINTFEKQIIGMSTRTTNANEMNPETAKISNLYKNFDEVVDVDYKSGSRVYGVYYNYESDASGEFSVLAGTDQLNKQTNKQLERITIPSGKYIIFEAKGQIPETIISTWGEIWDYFSSANCKYTRAYTKDFEFYRNENEVDIHISVK